MMRADIMTADFDQKKKTNLVGTSNAGGSIQVGQRRPTLVAMDTLVH